MRFSRRVSNRAQLAERPGEGALEALDAQVTLGFKLIGSRASRLAAWEVSTVCGSVYRTVDLELELC
jgi:hypothetical protein